MTMKYRASIVTDKKKIIFRNCKISLDLSQIESFDSGSIELTKEQVKAALTSLISIRKQYQKQTSTVETRKRRRNKSLDRSTENVTKKQKPIYNDIVLSNITQTETIVLATSGLNYQQIVS